MMQLINNTEKDSLEMLDILAKLKIDHRGESSQALKL
jgi:hypothetical protein